MFTFRQGPLDNPALKKSIGPEKAGDLGRAGKGLLGPDRKQNI